MRKFLFLFVLFLISPFISLSLNAQETINPEQSEKKLEQQKIEVIFVNQYLSRTKYNKVIERRSDWAPDFFPFFTAYVHFFAQSSTSQWANRCVAKFAEGIISKYPQSKGFERGNIINMLKTEMEKANIYAVSPHEYKPDKLTLIEKKKYPLTVSIQRYEITVQNQGKEDSPMFTAPWGTWSFDGYVWVNADIVIEINSSMSGKLIDRIAIKKDFEKKPVKFAVKVGPMSEEMKEGKECLTNALNEALEAYYKELSSTLVNYNWALAMEYSEK